RNSSDDAGAREISGATTDRRLTDVARFQSAKRRLPEQAVARLFVDPRQIERMIAASPPPSKASDARILPMLERYLGAVEYAAAALVWNNSGIVVHTLETLAPSKLDSWLLRWAGNDLGRDATLNRVPAGALALASGHLDAPAFLDALPQIVPDKDGIKLKNLEAVLSGLL